MRIDNTNGSLHRPPDASPHGLVSNQNTPALIGPGESNVEPEDLEEYLHGDIFYTLYIYTTLFPIRVTT